MNDQVPCDLIPIDDLPDDQKKEFYKKLEMMRGMTNMLVNEFYRKLSKKLLKLAKRYGGKLFLAPQNFWQEVGSALADYLMLGFTIPKGSTALTESTKKGHLIIAEYMAFGAVWSCYYAGMNVDEFIEVLKKKVEEKGAEGRQQFAEWFEEQTK